MPGARRGIVAATLSIGSAALVVVTLADDADLCHPTGWKQSAWIAAAVLAAGAIFASLRGRLLVKVVASIVAGALVAGGFLFLLLAQWVGACTA